MLTNRVNKAADRKMADDLDDLLDEIEDQFFNKKSHPSKPMPVVTSKKTTTSISDLDQIINDICSDDGFDRQPTPISPPHEHPIGSQTSPSHIGTKKCYSALLGGSKVAMGYSDGQKQRSCDQLRCTSCDFHVISFNDYLWHSRSEYLFFRNNVPEFDKLKKNLVKKKGSRAYACQCSWESVEGIVEVSSRLRLKWVCGRH